MRGIGGPSGSLTSPRPRPAHSRTALLRTGAALAAAGAALLLLVALGWQPLLAADRAVSDGAHRIAVDQPGLTHLSRILSDWVWDPLTMRCAVLAAVLLLLRAGATQPAAWAAGVTLTAWALQYLLKAVVGRERPSFADPVDSAPFWSFPSGHAMAATVSCGVLLVLGYRLLPPGGWRTAALTAAVTSAVGVGLTRVHLGVHWPSDVLAGWLFGAAVVTAAAALPVWRGVPPRDPAPGAALPGRPDGG
ncbi:phosphatase PAP2 family protein [Streptomyces sp. 549]|uniref:phosphatase PAP2 family protein n=1 Tax=Streptomyces sp. 549 TaxID=3049076 RepID=UPI0024C28E47|nr:phosphatase PAP2 family protein [Streptomyces sp. 549]MDK1473299.1 phosphatase PAP2 family protein [Streptomyces sp. 549]